MPKKKILQYENTFHENSLTISKLEGEKIILNSKINDQNSSIKLLLEQSKELKVQNEKIKSDISKLTTGRASDKNVILKLEKTIQENKTTISKFKKSAKIYKFEIERLLNLKWYQKLF